MTPVCSAKYVWLLNIDPDPVDQSARGHVKHQDFVSLGRATWEGHRFGQLGHDDSVVAGDPLQLEVIADEAWHGVAQESDVVGPARVRIPEWADPHDVVGDAGAQCIPVGILHGGQEATYGSDAGLS